MTYDASISISKKDIAYNYSIIKKQISNKDCKVSAVLKANAYGLGGQNIAPILYKLGVNDFFVANFKEALKLKKSLKFKKVNIYILYDLSKNNYKQVIKHKFIPVLNTCNLVKFWHENAGKNLCVIHIDTGLSRLGLDEKEIKKLAKEKVFDDMNIAYVMSHFSSANNKQDEPCEEEYNSFVKLTKYFPAGTKLSLANSGGIFRNKKYHFDMVRAGRTFYGLAPLAYKENPLKNAISLKAKVLQIKDVEKGQNIGYLRTYTAKKSGKIAVVGIGYADSLLRAHSNSGYLYFKGQKLPMIGLISMDIVTVDITNIKGIKEGDLVEVIGKNQTVDMLGAGANTNGCEILTSLSVRYNWVFKD